MKTSVDVLVALMAIKELETKTLYERIAQLEYQIAVLTEENNQLYTVLERQEHQIGFKNYRDEKKV